MEQNMNYPPAQQPVYLQPHYPPNRPSISYSHLQKIQSTLPLEPEQYPTQRLSLNTQSSFTAPPVQRQSQLHPPTLPYQTNLFHVMTPSKKKPTESGVFSDQCQPIPVYQKTYFLPQKNKRSTLNMKVAFDGKSMKYNEKQNKNQVSILLLSIEYQRIQNAYHIIHEKLREFDHVDDYSDNQRRHKEALLQLEEVRKQVQEKEVLIAESQGGGKKSRQVAALKEEIQQVTLQIQQAQQGQCEQSIQETESELAQYMIMNEKFKKNFCGLELSYKE